MSQSLENLSTEIDELRKQNRWLKAILVVVSCVPASLLLMGQAAPPRTIEGERFVLKDAGGKIRAGLFTTDTGAASLTFTTSMDTAGRSWP